MTPLVLVAAVLSVLPPSPTAPAQRLDIATLAANQDPVAPSWSRCPELYGVAIANWPDAVDVWATLDHVFWRESRCQPDVVNRYGCVGLMQICRGNFRRMAVNRTLLQDAGTNIATGYRLCQEWVAVGRSCWRPWHVGRWRP